MAPREDAPMFSFGSVRHLMNGPPLLLHIEAGSHQRRFASLRQSMDEINRKYYPTDLMTYELASAKFTSGRTICPHLTTDEKIALHIYTFANPPYYAKFNSVWYQCKNGRQPEELAIWGDFASDMLEGMRKLRSGPEGGDPPPKETRLFRIAHIPNDDYAGFYKQGKELVCKAFSSAATTEQWQFVEEGKKDGHTAAMLEFDARACRQAVDITDLSFFGDAEAERLFPPFFRGRITGKEETTNPLTGRQLERVFITSLPTLPPARPILDPAACGPRGILKIALLVGLHMGGGPPAGIEKGSSHETDPAPLLDGLLRIEKALRMMTDPAGEDVKAMIAEHARRVVAAEIDERRKGFLAPAAAGPALLGVRLVAGASAVASGTFGAAAAVGLSLPIVAMGLLVARSQIVESRRDQRVAKEAEEESAAMAEGLRGRTEKALASEDVAKLELARELRLELGLELEQSRASDSIARHHGEYRAKLREPPVEGAADPGAAAKSEKSENELFVLALKMDVQSQVMAEIMTAGLGVGAEGLLPFPLGTSELDTMLSTGSELLKDPEEAARGLGGTDRARRLAQYALGNACLLRYVLARARFIFTLGVPDAGKSTFLQKVYGIKCPAGLTPAGRTRAISLYPHPEYYDEQHSPVFLADVPGFGDRISARNDISRYISSLASSPAFRRSFSILIFIPSGRPLKSVVKELVDDLDAKGVPCEYIITKVDKNYEDRVMDLHEKYKAGEPAGVDMKKPAEREKVAKEIMEEDVQQVNGKPYAYMCLAGWAAETDAAESDDEDDDNAIQPKYKFIKKSDVDKFFKPMSVGDIGHRIDAKLGLG